MIADKILSTISAGFGMVFQGIRKTLVDTFGLVTSYHNESMKFARSAGMSLQQAHAYTKVLTTRAAELGQKYGLAASEVQNLERNLQNAVSRQLMLSDEQAEKMIQINRLVGEGVSSTYSEQMVTKMGAQIDTVQGAIAKAYGTAMKSGLNAEKMTQKISQNLSMANRLSFRNGIDGLTRMAMLSEKMGMNMQSVESAAGNFMELDKAIENAAHLQMLGGSAGAMFGNPLTAAYEANYDPEAFAKRMSDSLASYATFDASKGISSINGMNMDFVRNIAKAMGISAEEAASMAKKQAEVRYKENNFGTALDRMSGGDQMKRDMLINKSTIQNGQLGMVSMKDNKFHEMSYYESGEGKKEMDEMMAMYGKSDSEIMMEIASTEKTISEQLSGLWTSITGKIADVLNKFDVLPKIQKFIDEKGAMLVEYVAKGVDWVLNGGLSKWWEDKWKWVQNTWDSAKKWGTGIATVLGVIAAWKIGKGALGLVRGASAGASGVLGKGLNAAKSVGKWAVKGLKNFAKPGRLVKTMGVGLAGALGNVAVDSYFEKNPEKKGSVGHYTGKMASTAVEYGALGSMFGPIGTGIGAAVGAVKGAYDTWKSLPENADKNFLDYTKNMANGAWEGIKYAGSKIGEGLSWVGGKVSEGVSWVSERISERGGLLKVAFNAVTTPFRAFIGIIEGIAKNIMHPVELVKKAWNALTNNPIGKLTDFIFGEKEGAKPKKYAVGGVAYGGEPGRDSVPALLTPGERVLTNDQYQTLVKPKPTGAKEYIYNPGNTSVSNVNGNKITVKDFNVNISGTIKIDAGNSFANIDAASLLRDISFVNQLKNVIKESINNDMNSGRFMNDLATRRGQTTSTSLVGKL